MHPKDTVFTQQSFIWGLAMPWGPTPYKKVPLSYTSYWQMVPLSHTYNTCHKSLKQEPFVLNFLQISYIHSSHLCSHSNVPLSFPNVEPSVFWSTEMTANPNQHWRGVNHTRCFKICDEDCSLEICIPFNCCNCIFFKIWILIIKPKRFLDFFTAINCTCCPFWAFLTTEMTDFLTLSYV